MDIKEKIKQYLEYKGISDYRFEKDLSLSRGYINKAKNPTSDVLIKMCGIYTDLNTEWLLRGTGEMLCCDELKQPHLETEDKCMPIENSDMDKIPHRKFVEITPSNSSNPMCIINTDRIIKVEGERGKVCTFYLDEDTIIESSFKLETVRDLLGIPYAF